MITNWLFLDILEKVDHVASCERRLPEEDLIEYSPDGPDISLIIVLLVVQHFRSHIQR